MSRAPSCALSPALWFLLACNASPGLAPEQLAPKAEPAAEPAPMEASPSAQLNGAPDPRLPIVGDPLGLLSRPAPAPAAREGKKPSAKSTAGFDPGALMASAQRAPQTIVTSERDPRAVARVAQEMAEPRKLSPAARAGSVPVREVSASELLGGIRKSAARPHVLFLYAAYCPACRHVLPNFLPLVEHYRQRNVLFTAASVDRDASAYADYAPVLNGVLPPIWIRPEGETRKELIRAGLSIGDTYGIPLVAVFDKAHRLVRQGGSEELSRLSRTLDSLVQ